MDWLFSLYIGCTIFGVGVTLIDMLGILGDIFHHAEEGFAGGDHGALSDGTDHGDHGDFADHGDHGDGHDSGHAWLNHSDHGAGHTGDHDGGHHGKDAHGVHHDTVSGHDAERDLNIVPRLLTMIRSLVHFSLGFGPVGVFALATGRTAVASVAWSVPVGLFALIGGRILRRIQQRELDSQIMAADLLMEKGEVLVSIGQGQLGRVRVYLDSVQVDRYARASDPQKRLPVGTSIRVVDVSDDCVYVEEES